MKINDVIINEYETGNIGKNVSTPGNKNSSGSSDTYGSRVANAVKGTVDNANKRPQDGFADAYASRNNPNGTKLTKDKVTQPGKDNKGAGTKSKAKYKFDQAVQDRQKELIAAGAKIKADGFDGPATKQAEKDFGAKADAAKVGDKNSTSAYAPTVSDRAKTDPNVSGDQKQGTNTNIGIALPGDRKADTPPSATTTTPPPETTPWGGKKDAAKSTWDGSTSATPDVDRSPKPDELAAIKKNAGLPPGLDSATKAQGSPVTGQTAQANPDYGNMSPQDAATAYDAQLKAQGKDGLEKGQGVVGTGTGKAMTTGTGSPLQYDHSDAMMAWRQAHPMQSPPDHETAKKWYEKEQARKLKQGTNTNIGIALPGDRKEESSALSILRKLSGL